MRIVSEQRLGAVLGALPGTPRVVAGGNFATPWRALSVLDAAVAEYRLFALNAQAGIPDRDGVTLESPFVGPGMRGRERLRYFPCRLSLVPVLLATVLPPDVVLVQTSAPSGGTVSLGTEVNVLPAAIEAARARGGLVIAQLNPSVPYTYGDAVLHTDDIDYAIEAETPLPSPPPRPASATAAATDFVVGALHSPGGLAVIALPSWHPKANVSTVVPRLDGPVTSFQHSYIVSEQGTAAIWGHDSSGQAGQIISQVAHPSVREQLRQAGRDLGLRV
ncbi:MAG TPA: acetyl-CoA hydrolase/transferase C-terminal domain-containing protein [Trebonia sp.]